MSISSVNSNSSVMMKGMPHPDPAKMAEDLFSKLDTTGKGYIEKSAGLNTFPYRLFC